MTELKEFEKKEAREMPSKNSLRWIYGCQLGLQQGTCGRRYKFEKNSCGHFAGLGGCPSCLYRVPGSEATREAEGFREAEELQKEIER